jgi:hypothetical protein
MRAAGERRAILRQGAEEIRRGRGGQPEALIGPLPGGM